MREEKGEEGKGRVLTFKLQFIPIISLLSGIFLLHVVTVC